MAPNKSKTITVNGPSHKTLAKQAKNSSRPMKSIFSGMVSPLSPILALLVTSWSVLVDVNQKRELNANIPKPKIEVLLLWRFRRELHA
jgi:hypothetical protein